MTHEDHGLGYRGDIEGLRAVSILLVVALHAGLPMFAGGFVGVDVFFVISGFLITGLLALEFERSGRIHFAAFYARRLRRLLPALLLMLGTVCAFARLMLTFDEQRVQAFSAAMASLWISNFEFAFQQVDYFAPDKDTNLFLHTWSLGVEEQFYLLWPVLLALLLARGKIRRAAWTFGAIVAGGFLACWYVTSTLPTLAFYLMPLRAWQFAAGGLAWLLFGRRPVNTNRRSPQPLVVEIVGWFGLAMVVFAAMTFDSSTPYPGLAALVPTLGAVGVLSAGSLRADAGVSRILGLAPFQAIGRISYSWYLWHWPVLLLGRAIQTSTGSVYLWGEVLLSLLLAIASYHAVEAPIRRQGYWVAHKRIAISGSLGVMAIATALAIRWYEFPVLPNLDPDMARKRARYVQASTESPVIYARGCNAGLRSTAVSFCSFGRIDAPHTAVLMGDSTAAQWSPAAVEAFDRPDWRLLVATKSGCPAVDGPYFYPALHREYTECAMWREEAIRQVAATRPDIVILSSYWWVNRSLSRDWWVTGTRSVLGALSDSSGHVYVLRSTPRLPFQGPRCLLRELAFGNAAGARFACQVRYADPHEKQVFSWIQFAAERFRNVSTIDMNQTICPQGVCDAERDGQIIFRDDHHLATHYASLLGPALAAQVGLGAAAGEARKK